MTPTRGAMLCRLPAPPAPPAVVSWRGGLSGFVVVWLGLPGCGPAVAVPTADDSTSATGAAMTGGSASESWVTTGEPGSADVRVGTYGWPPPAWASPDPLAWLGLGAVLLEDACDGSGSGDGGGGFIPDLCAADESPLAVLLLHDEGQTTVANANMAEVGSRTVYVLAEHREWITDDCGHDDVYTLALSGPGL